MWLIILQKYWSQLALLLLLLLSLIYMNIVKNALNDVTSERDQYKSALDYQNAELLEQKVKYEEALAKLPKEIEKITVKYKTQYKYVDNWEGDKNASDCENAYSFLRSANY